MINQKAYFKHQKTALTDGFTATVDGKLSNVPQTELSIIYHKTKVIFGKSNYAK